MSVSVAMSRAMESGVAKFTSLKVLMGFDRHNFSIEWQLPMFLSLLYLYLCPQLFNAESAI